jgi:ABC-2 type transport system permease protein
MVQLKHFLRDPIYLFFILVFPLVFLFIFGTIFGGSRDVNLTTALLNNSDTEFAQDFVERLKAQESQSLKILSDDLSFEDARLKMARGEIDSIIELPPGFGSVGQTAAQQGEESPAAVTQTTPPSVFLPTGQLRVYYDEGSPQAGQIVATIMTGILDQINGALMGTTPPLSVEQVSVGVNGLSQFDYIFSGLLSYVLMTMGIYALSQQLPAEKRSGSLRRIKATPFRAWQLLTGLALAYLLLTLLSAALMIGVSMVVFDFQMRGSWLVLAAFSIVSALAMIGIGALVAGVARNSNQATVASQSIAFPMMFLSGVFFPRYLMPDFLQNISSWIPLTPVGDGIRYITTEGVGLPDLLPQLFLISAWGIVAYVLAFRLFKWE